MQEKLKKELSKVKRDRKSKDHENVLYNVEMFYEARKYAINLFHDYAKILSEVNWGAIQQKGYISDLAGIACVTDVSLQ